jgi:hypothetical protein
MRPCLDFIAKSTELVKQRIQNENDNRTMRFDVYITIVKTIVMQPEKTSA